MSKLIVVSFMSLDGYYEGPGKQVEALPMDPGFFEYNLERIKSADTVLLGARSYRQFRDFWPAREHDRSASAADRAFSKIYNTIEKVVVSDHTSLPPKGHPWASTTRLVARRQAHRDIGKMRARQGRDIVIWGSRTLWTDLLTHNLVDEFHLIVGNAAVGGGTRMFKTSTEALTRLDARALRHGNSTLIRFAHASP